MRQVHLDPFVCADHRDRLFDRREHPEAQQVHLHDSQVRAIVLVPLHDDAPGHGGRLQRHDLVQPSRRDDYPARVLPEVARQVLDLEEEAQEVLRADVPRVEAGRGDLAGEILHRIADFAEAPAAELLGEVVHLLGRITHRLPRFARRRAVAVGDDVGCHAGSVGTVFRVDVLDDFLALVARGKVEIDVRPFSPLLREEPLEEQVHLHRVHGRDRKRVADGAVGRGATALHEDLLGEAELHDVPDDQEVTGQIELLDHRQLLLDLRLRARRQRLEARPRAVPGHLPEVRSGSLAGRQRIFGEAVAQVRQREVEYFRELPRGVERPGQIGKEPRHLPRAFQMPLTLRREEPSRGVERRVVADRGQNIVQILVLRPGITRAVGREDRQAHSPRQVEEGPVAVLFLAQAMALQLDMEAAREDRGEPLESPARGVQPLARQRARCRPLLSARQAVKPLRVRRDLFPGRGGLSLGLSRRAGRDQAAKVLVAGAVLDEEGETGEIASCEL